MALTIQNNLIVFIDVDETLLMQDGITGPGFDVIEIIHPLDKEIVYAKVHKAHRKLLRRYNYSGYTVIVWSAQGHQWATAAVEALNIRDCVTIIMSKPTKFVDDLPAAQVLGTRVYIPFEGPKVIPVPALPEEE